MPHLGTASPMSTEPFADCPEILQIDVDGDAYSQEGVHHETVVSPVGELVEEFSIKNKGGCLWPLWGVLLCFTVGIVVVSIASIMVHQTVVKNELVSDEREQNRHNLETIYAQGDSTIDSLITDTLETVHDVVVLRYVADMNGITYPILMLQAELAQSHTEGAAPDFLKNLRRRLMSTSAFDSPFSLIHLAMPDNSYARLASTSQETAPTGYCSLTCGTLVPINWTGLDDLKCTSQCTCTATGTLQCIDVPLGTGQCLSEPNTTVCDNVGGVAWSWALRGDVTATTEYWKKINGSAPLAVSTSPVEQPVDDDWYKMIPTDEPGHLIWLMPTVDAIFFQAALHGHDGVFLAGVRVALGHDLVALNLDEYLPTKNSVLWMVGTNFTVLTYTGDASIFTPPSNELATISTLHHNDATDWAAGHINQIVDVTAQRYNMTREMYLETQDFTTLATDNVNKLNLTGGPPSLEESKKDVQWLYTARLMEFEHISADMILCLLVPDMDLVGEWENGKVELEELIEKNVNHAENKEVKYNTIAIAVACAVLIVAVLLALAFSRIISRHVSNMGKQFEMISLDANISNDDAELPRPIFREMANTHRLFLSVIQHLRDLRSFIPQAVLDLEVAPQPDPTAVSDTTYNEDISNANGGTIFANEMMLSRQASIQKLQIGLKPRKATLMCIKADLYDVRSGLYDQADPGILIEHVLRNLKDFDGVVLTLTAGSILGTWNAHTSYPAHAEQACHCALKIAHDLRPHTFIPWWGIVLSSGKVLVGHVGNVWQKAPAVLGAPLSLLNALTYLTPVLKTRILISESTYELAQGKIVARPVDVVPSDPSLYFNEHRNLHKNPTHLQPKDVKVYELLSSGDAMPSNRFGDYVAAFNYFWKHSFPEAVEKLQSHLLDNAKDPQALRLLHLAEVARNNELTLPTPYVRRPFMWEDFDLKGGPVDLEGSDSDPMMKCVRVDTQNRNALVNGGVGGVSFANVSIQHNQAASALRKELLREVEKAGECGDSESSSLEHDEPPMSWRDELGNVWWRSQNSIGKGAFGEVWQAMGQDGSFVAVKVLSLAKFRHASPVSARSPIRPSKLPRRYSTDSSDMCASMTIQRFAPTIPGNNQCGSITLSPMPTGLRHMSRRQSEDTEFGDMSEASMSRDAPPVYSKVGQVAMSKGMMQTMGTLETELQMGEGEEGEEAFDEIIKEVAVLSEIKHDNIVSYTSSCVINGYVMICMEYVGGGSIHDLIQRFGNLPLCSVKRYIKDTCCGLHHLHGHGVVHCDVKPHNILLTCTGQCKLADFGASTKIRSRKGQALGSPLYMAPEACRGVVTSASDIWGLGVTATEMLTGEVPYESKVLNPFFFMQRLKQGPENGPNLAVLEEEFDEGTVGFIKECLSYVSTDRPTAKELCMHRWFDLMGDPLPTERSSIGGPSASTR